MIKAVLRVIRDLGVVNKREIAEKTGIEESTLEQVITLLASKGYLKTVDSTEEMPSGCIGCPISRECMQEASAGSVYVITEKGKNYLEKN